MLCLRRWKREIRFDGLGMAGDPPSRELEAEVLGQNARDCRSVSVHPHGAADDAGVFAELALKQVPGDHDAVLLAWAEKAAKRRSGAGQAPEVAVGKYGRGGKRVAAG